MEIKKNGKGEEITKTWEELNEEEKNYYEQKIHGLNISYIFAKKLIKKKIKKLRKDTIKKNSWNLFYSIFNKSKIPEGENKLKFIKKAYYNLNDEEKQNLLKDENEDEEIQFYKKLQDKHKIYYRPKHGLKTFRIYLLMNKIQISEGINSNNYNEISKAEKEKWEKLPETEKKSL